MKHVKIYEYIGFPGSGKTSTYEEGNFETQKQILADFQKLSFLEKTFSKTTTLLSFPSLFFYFLILFFHCFQWKYTPLGPLAELLFCREKAKKMDIDFLVFDESLGHFFLSYGLYKKYDSPLYKKTLRKIFQKIECHFSIQYIYFHSDISQVLTRLNTREKCYFDTFALSQKKDMLVRTQDDIEYILKNYSTLSEKKIYTLDASLPIEKKVKIISDFISH